MSERQSHGFNFEKFIKEKYNIKDYDNNYTAPWDGILNNIPVSIKLEKYGTDVEMASILRNSQNMQNFYLIVGFWKETKDNIVEIVTLFINGEEWHKLFNEQLIQECQNLINNISNDKKDDEIWKKEINRLKKLWSEKTPNLIRPRFKRDHKKQKRIQCAINNKDFYDYFVKKYKKEL